MPSTKLVFDMKKIRNFWNNHFIPLILNLFFNTIGKFSLKIFGTEDKRLLKHNVSLCLIFKDEGRFLKEWLDFHLTIGIDHFYLYDNNSTDNYYSVIKPYINKGIVTLIDWPYKQAQAECYKHCLETFKHETNWIGYIDADEFICPKYANDINDWIKDYAKYPAIRIDWLQFGTNGLIDHDYSKNVIEQYFSCWNEFWMGKSFVNTRYEITNWNTQYFHHHSYVKYRIFGINMSMPAVNQWGYISPMNHSWGGGYNKVKNSNIHINHYYTKAWNVYKEKMQRPDVYFEKNAKDLHKLLSREMKCIDKNYTILRFLQKMRYNNGYITL